MKRVIKFRAWDGQRYITFDNHKYDLIYNDISGWNVAPNLHNYKGEWAAGESQDKTPDFILEQFTGLTDKNGKEIYEGDILKVNTSVSVHADKWLFDEPDEVEQEIICEVVYREEIACFDLDTIEADLHLKNWGFYDTGENELEVIGNIHQNPIDQ